MSDQNNRLVPFRIGSAPESEMIEYNMNHQQQFSGITGNSPSMLNSQQISPVVTRYPNPYPGGPAFPPPQILLQYQNPLQLTIIPLPCLEPD